MIRVGNDERSEVECNGSASVPSKEEREKKHAKRVRNVWSWASTRRVKLPARRRQLSLVQGQQRTGSSGGARGKP